MRSTGARDRRTRRGRGIARGPGGVAPVLPARERRSHRGPRRADRRRVAGELAARSAGRPAADPLPAPAGAHAGGHRRTRPAPARAPRARLAGPRAIRRCSRPHPIGVEESQRTAPPGPRDRARHALVAVLGGRACRRAVEVDEHRVAVRAEAHACQLGVAVDVDAEDERPAAGRDPDQAVDVLDAGRPRVAVDERGGGVVLADHEPAARRHGQVVRRVERLAARRFVVQGRSAVNRTARAAPPGVGRPPRSQSGHPENGTVVPSPTGVPGSTRSQGFGRADAGHQFRAHSRCDRRGARTRRARGARRRRARARARMPGPGDPRWAPGRPRSHRGRRARRRDHPDAVAGPPAAGEASSHRRRARRSGPRRPQARGSRTRARPPRVSCGGARRRRARRAVDVDASASLRERAPFGVSVRPVTCITPASDRVSQTGCRSGGPWSRPRSAC